MFNIFLMARNFFQPQIEFCVQTNLFEKKFCMQNLFFYVHNVILDTLGFFPFRLTTFFKDAENSYFCKACLCMPLSKSDILKNQH